MVLVISCFLIPWEGTSEKGKRSTVLGSQVCDDDDDGMNDC